MAGHSKFKNIQHRKGAQDKKRAKVFTKLIKEITVAAKMGAPDPDMNPRLRMAIVAAKAANMPKDNVDRAIKKATDPADMTSYDEIRYEGYGPAGIAVIVEALTDNRNRTASEVRSAFTKNGGSLGETNSVSFMFDRLGQIVYPIDKASEEEMFEATIEAGGENVEIDDDIYEITCEPTELNNVRESLEKRFGDANSVELIWKPKTLTSLDESAATTLLKLIDILEDNDDVQTVYANYDVSDEVLEKLAQ
jgi:YebC/PmpR family DNA-binding regulatory protein